MDAIRGHIAELEPEVLILNAGKHQHQFDEAWYRSEIMESIMDMSPTVPERVIWKTTTVSRGPDFVDGRTDETMCMYLGECMNVTWTKNVPYHLYYDVHHFLEPVYRLLNLQLLVQLGIPIPAKAKGKVSWYPDVPIPGLAREDIES